ncbi:MAG: 4Fe-4S dicluster domain-containing protein [bacterium]|nr:4Fe-4S dicluster domain-containing protein [bacterium]
MKKVEINREYCKCCGICIEVCPVNVLSVSKEFNTSGVHPVELIGDCIACGKCYLMCPDFAIEVKEND